MDERLNTLSRWAARILDTPVELASASGDASFRRYYRVFSQSGDTCIAMDAPPEHESVALFARVATRFRELGLNVPMVHAVDEKRGFALLSDLGNRTYLSVVNEGNVDFLYRDALDALWRLQSASVARTGIFEIYDADELNREMELFRQWFVPWRTSYRLTAADQETLSDTFDLLTASALEQPRVWVHRDYHCRNLMYTPSDNPGVLDFQDAVCGPVTYDLVSLLRDCYIVWPEARVEAWLRDYYQRLRPALGADAPDYALFVRWFDWMGVQRHIKVLGIFTRLFHRDGKANYLGDLPVVHHYVRDVCGRYPELQPFRRLLDTMEVTWTS